MLRSAPLFLLFLSACLPSIPQRSIEPRAHIPERLPSVSPCALMHGEADESLSNAAHGWFRGPWKLAYSSFLIRHPNGVVLVDAAFGDDVDHDLDAAPFWFRWLFGSTRSVLSIAELLRNAGVAPEEVTHVLITHAHWDHTGGLLQLPNARVLVDATEAEWILASNKHLVDGGMPHHFDASVRARIERVTYPGPAYDGFPKSFDVFNDGSFVAVPLSGHSPGSTGWFVNSGDGKRWLFAGDAAWVKEGVEEPVTKDRLVTRLSDWDSQLTANQLGLLHATYEAKSASVVLSHDERTWRGVPRCENISAAR